jgi:hypothetical protein
VDYGPINHRQPYFLTRLKNVLITLLLFTGAASYAQDFRIKRDSKKLIVLENSVAKDTIMLWRPESARHRLVGNSLYYTDGFFVPDVLRLMLYKVNVKDLSAPRKEIVAKAFDLNHEYLMRVKLKKDKLVVIYRTEGKRKKTIVEFKDLQ